jgi:hypothetical protein|tara:strand:- start:656 stop:1042 length:387 start_codon:yes stop_codon:yes gene_type:complete
MANDKTNSELVRELLEAFTSLKTKMEDPNYVQLESSINNLLVNQTDMKKDVSELKKRLLNPYDGAIVEITKNTDFRKEWERDQKSLERMQEEHRDLLKWKSNFVKIFWTVFTTAVGVIAFMVTNTLNK